MMVQPTPGGGLTAGVRKALATVRGPDGGTAMVTERAGKSILSGLMAADLALEKGCHWEEKPCLVEGEKNCWASRLVYSLACTICGAQFVGTMCLTLHARGRQHLEALLGGNLRYPMTKHYR